MKIAIVIAAVCIAACFAEPKPVIRQAQGSSKPGRFLSLPVPEKCAKRGQCPARLTSRTRAVARSPARARAARPRPKARPKSPPKPPPQSAAIVTTTPGRFLSQPVPSKCARRPKQFSYRGKNMFLTSQVPAYANKKLDWLDGRNFCREFCMDLVSITTPEKNSFIYGLIRKYDVPYIWTSGRICDFEGCENRPDLEPKNIYGWFWSATREKITATNRIPPGWSYNPWSQTGYRKRPQPDNAEYGINETKEQCLSILNNVYNDGIQWHDVACYHEKPVICEDNEELLRYIAQTNPGIHL